jgi:hypothetical protein
MKMKTVVKLGTILSVLLFVLAVGYYAFMRLDMMDRNRDVNLFSLVPSSSVGVLESNNVHAFFDDYSMLNYSDELEKMQFPGLFNFLIHGLNMYAGDNAHGLSYQMNQLVVSFHQPVTPHNQVVYLRLGMADEQLLSDMLREYVSGNFLPKEEEYRGKKILIYPLSHDEFLATYTEEGFVVLSYQKRLVEEVIDAQLDETALGYDAVFSRVLDKKKSKDFLTLYGRSSSIPSLDLDSNTWSEYDFHLNSDVVYLTGDMYALEINAEKENMIKSLNDMAVVKEEGLFVSAEKDSTTYYMAEAFDANDTGNRTLFNECVANLANEVDFSLVADMQKVEENPQRFQSYLPSFMIENASLLRSFILSAQLSLNGERPSHIWVFTYKD